MSLLHRELVELIDEAATRLEPTEYGPWLGQQTVTVAGDPTVPNAPAITAAAADQAIDLTLAVPSTNTDGSPYLDHKEFIVYYSTSPGIDINDPATYSGTFTTSSTRHTFPTKYNHYFRAVACDKYGNRSVASDEVLGSPLPADVPEVDDYVQNIANVVIGAGIIGIEFQSPKDTWIRWAGWKLYYDVDDGTGWTGTWTHIYTGAGPGFLHKGLNENYRYKYKLAVLAEDGTESPGTIADNGGAGYQPNAADNSAIVGVTIFAERMIASKEMIAQTFIGGKLQSTNWGTTAGTQLDLDAGTFKTGGSSAPKLSWDGSSLVVIGKIVNVPESSVDDNHKNLVPNPYFQKDTNDDGVPDSWTLSTGWTRDSSEHCWGDYSLKGGGTAATATSAKVPLPSREHQLKISGLAKGTISPTTPSTHSSVDLTDGGALCAKEGTTLAVIDDKSNNIIKLYDLSNSVSYPALKASITLSSEIVDIAMAGKRLYVAQGTRGNTINIYDVRDPSTPTLLYSYDITSADAGTWYVTGINIAGDYLVIVYYSIGTAKLQTVDISSPAAATHIATLTLASGSNEKTGRVFAEVGRCLVVGESGGTGFSCFNPNIIWVVTINSRGMPTLEGNYSVSGQYLSGDLAFAGNFAYIPCVDVQPLIYRHNYSSSTVRESNKSMDAVFHCASNLICTRSGRLWVAYTGHLLDTSGVHAPIAAYSDDGGESWTEEEVPISTGIDVNNLRNGTVAVDPDGHLHYLIEDNNSLAWVERTTTWGTPEDVGLMSGARSLLIIDDSGHPHIIYLDSTGSYLYHTWRTSSSDDWEANAESITAINNWNVCRPVAAFYINSNLHVIYYDENADATGRQFYHVYKSGSTWSTPQVAVPDTESPSTIKGYPAACADDNGNIYLAYVNGGSDLCLAQYDGTSWSHGVVIDSSATYGDCVLTTRDGKGNIWVVGQTGTTQLRVWKRDVTTGSWVTVRDVSFNSWDSIDGVWGMQWSPWTKHAGRAYGSAQGLAWFARGQYTSGTVIYYSIVYMAEADTHLCPWDNDTTFCFKVLDISTPSSITQVGSDLGEYTGSSGDASYRTGTLIDLDGEYLYTVRVDNINSFFAISVWSLSSPSAPSWINAESTNVCSSFPTAGPQNVIVRSGYVYYSDPVSDKLYIDTLLTVDWELRVAFYDVADNLLVKIVAYDGNNDQPRTGSDWTYFQKTIPVNQIPSTATKIEFELYSNTGDDYVYVDSLEAILV